MDIKTQRDKLDAAYHLLTRETTTLEKFEKATAILKGIHPDIDRKLSACFKAVKNLRNIEKGEVIEIAAETLPEHTPEQKKKKKALLLFLSLLKDLRSEIKRVRGMYDGVRTDGKVTGHEHMSVLTKAFAFAKGPFGLVTAAAVVIVGASAYLHTSSVNVSILNSGCSSISPVVKLPVPVPGLKLPTDTIEDGEQGTAVVPNIKVRVDGTEKGVLTLSVLGFNGSYTTGTDVEILFDGRSLSGSQTDIDLGTSKEHELVIRC